MENKLISTYEQETNRMVAKIMRITSIFMVIVLLLNLVGLFTIPMGTMIFIVIFNCTVLWIPTILERSNWSDSLVKYIEISCAVVSVCALAITVSFHAVLFYIYPIALASLYFNKKLNIFSLIATIIGVTIGICLDFKFQFVKDYNMKSVSDAICFIFIPRVLALATMSSIFFQRSERQSKVIENEQQQKDMIDEMSNMKKLTAEASKTLLASVATLSSIYR